MREKLFPYGTLQDKKVQRSVFGRQLHSAADKLSGYEKYRIRIQDKTSGNFYPAIQLSVNNKMVPGTVFQLTKEELATADRYEGNSYLRIKLKLESGVKACVWLVK
ncbi:gamma-glutamylcyclotransferase [Gramella sp. KN1008]|nr:gamma-glutamylcyclotransferase [Gramella sp. KN1008]